MVLQELFRFIYPGGCLVCQESKERIDHYLCKACQTSVELTDALFYLQDVYCFDECDAITILLSQYKKSFSPNLRALLVSWMMVQFLKMDWDMPDYIAAAAAEEVTLLKRNPTNKTLARSFAKMLGKPLLDLFGYRLQDGVYDDKGDLLGSLYLKPCKSLQGKTLLIIQDEKAHYVEYANLLQDAGVKIFYKIALYSKESI